MRMVMMSWNTEEQVRRFIEGKASTDQLIQWCPADEVEDLVQHMKSEANRHWSIDPDVSLKLANGIIRVGKVHHCREYIALGRMARGDAQKNLGEFELAWADLQAAGQIYRYLGDEVGWARTRIGLLIISVNVSKTDQAIREAHVAYRIFRRLKQPNYLINLEMNFGVVHMWIGQCEEALKYLESAVLRAQKMQEKGETYLGRLYLNIGYVHRLNGDFDNAKTYYQRAQSLFRKHDEHFSSIYVDQNLAYIAETTGQIKQALRTLHNALDNLDNQSLYQSSQIQERMASCFIQLNRHHEAVKLLRSVVTNYETLNANYATATTLFYLATAEASLGRYDEARQVLNKAENLFKELDSSMWYAKLKTLKAAVLLQENAFDEAEELAREAAEEFFSEQHYFQGIYGSRLYAEAMYKKGEYDDARVVAHRTLRFARKHNHAQHRYGTHLLLGKIYEAQKDTSRARAHFRAAVATVDYLHKNLTITLRSDYLKDKNDALHGLIGLHLRSGNVEDAFETLERTKSQVFFYYLNSRENLNWVPNTSRTGELRAELEQLRQKLMWYQTILAGDKGLDNAKSAISQNQATIEMVIIEKRLRQVTEQLYLHIDNQHSTPLALPNLASTQSALKDNECLIEYYNNGSDLFVFIVKRKSIDVYPLEITLEQVDRRITQLQFNIACSLKAGSDTAVSSGLGKQFKQLMNAVYSGLLAPISCTLPDCSRLIIVPYGNLHYLPFHLLYTGRGYLIEEVEVVILPAAGLLNRPKSDGKRQAMVLSHSYNGSLPKTIDEGRTVYQLLGGKFRAEKSALREYLENKDHQVLHIAAHGEFRIDQPDLSFIFLGDGPTYTDDFLQYDLSYELITLSACETGRAQVAPGDELIGLGRGCLYAGAGALILSMWRVDDETTTEIMKSIYQSLLTGASKAAAVRDAQRSMLENYQTMHPAFWGAFQLIGNAEPLST